MKLIMGLCALIITVAIMGCGTVATEVEITPVEVTEVTPVPPVEEESTSPTDVELMIPDVNINANIGRDIAGRQVGLQDAKALNPVVGSFDPSASADVTISVVKNRDLAGKVVGLPKSHLQVSKDILQKTAESDHDTTINITRRNKYAGKVVGLGHTRVG